MSSSAPRGSGWERERAEAAREAEEARVRRAREEHSALEVRKAAAIERERVLATVEAERRRAEEERGRLAATSSPRRTPSSRFFAGMALGVLVATGAAVGTRFAFEASRAEHAAEVTSRMHAELEEERARAEASRVANDAALEQLRRENDALRAAARPTQPVSSVHVVAPVKVVTAPKKPTCIDPHDPLCGDLDAR